MLLLCYFYQKDETRVIRAEIWKLMKIIANHGEGLKEEDIIILYANLIRKYIEHSHDVDHIIEIIDFIISILETVYIIFISLLLYYSLNQIKSNHGVFSPHKNSLQIFNKRQEIQKQ